MRKIAAVSALFLPASSTVLQMIAIFFLLKWLFDSSLRAVPPHCSFESKYNLLPTQET